MRIASLWHGTLWSAARRVINLGTYRGQVARAAQLVRGDRVVDVGCGTGEMAPIVPSGCRYLGVDLSTENLERARRAYGGPDKTFQPIDVTRERLPDGPFDVALLVAVMHHIDDATFDAAMSHLAPQIRKRVVVLDLLALEGNPIQKLFVAFDQGHFVRSFWQQKAMIERHLDIVSGEVFATRSGSATHSLFVCEPRHVRSAGSA